MTLSLMLQHQERGPTVPQGVVQGAVQDRQLAAAATLDITHHMLQQLQMHLLCCAAPRSTGTWSVWAAACHQLVCSDNMSGSSMICLQCQCAGHPAQAEQCNLRLLCSAWRRYQLQHHFLKQGTCRPGAAHAAHSA